MYNPQAFPSTGEGFGNPKYSAPGMTLRDYFAAKAMTVIMADWYSDADRITRSGFPCDSENAGDIAELAFVMADAMLEARS